MNKDIKNSYFEENNIKKKNIFEPDYYFSHITKITPEFLTEKKIKALILDVDNTLIDIDKKLSDEIVQWSKTLRGLGYKLLILSNTNNEQKVKDVADKLNIEYMYLAKKPFKKGFIKAQEKLNEKPDKIVVIGDQIFTDVIGGNRVNMNTILVDPIDKRDYWYTAWKRPFENQRKKKLNKIA